MKVLMLFFSFILIACGENYKNDQIVNKLLENNEIDQEVADKLKDSNEPLQGIDLRGLSLKGFDFSERNLLAVNFEGADLRKAKFIGANLKGANLKEARFNNANLINANMERVTAEKAVFAEAILANANLDWGRFDDANFNNVRMNGATVKRASFQRVDFTTTDLTGVDAKRENVDEDINFINMADAKNAKFKERDAYHPAFVRSYGDYDDVILDSIAGFREYLQKISRTRH